MLKCPNCGEDYITLRLHASVFLPFEINENGTPYLLDISGHTREDIIENIEIHGDEEYSCLNCRSTFKAIEKDDFDFEVGEQI